MDLSELLHEILTVNANNLGSTDARDRGAYTIKQLFAEYSGTPCDKAMWECEINHCDHRCGYKGTDMTKEKTEWKDTLYAALSTYGITHQTLILAEECSEVVKAATKLVRNPEQDYGNLVEEIADVVVMLTQMCLYYKIEKEQIERAIDYKIDRLSKRLIEKQQNSIEQTAVSV